MKKFHLFIFLKPSLMLFTKKLEDVIHFEVANHKTSISKSHFCKLLGLITPEVSVDPESIPATNMIEMLYQMGYTDDISKFRKSLPPMWNGLFTILFKSLSERVTGSDSASKHFYTLIYGLYHGINLDYGSVIQNQFIQGTTSSTQHT